MLRLAQVCAQSLGGTHSQQLGSEAYIRATTAMSLGLAVTPDPLAMPHVLCGHVTGSLGCAVRCGARGPLLLYDESRSSICKGC
jgi:hypothetical protein